jgi:hypothetical protein
VAVATVITDTAADPGERALANGDSKRSWIPARTIGCITIQDLSAAAAPRQLSPLLSLTGQDQLKLSGICSRYGVGSGLSRSALTLKRQVRACASGTPAHERFAV